MKTSQKTRAVFLDRDGVLTKRPHPTWKKSQLRLQDGVATFIRLLNKRKIPVIVVTNQGGVVARCLISPEGVEKLHKILETRLKGYGAHISHFYFCPHHPKGTIAKYRKKCSCRKPKIGMFKRAEKDFSINLKKSVIIGDMTQDIFAGEKAGIKTILLDKGHRGRDGKYKVAPDYKAKNFKAVKLFLSKQGFL